MKKIFKIFGILIGTILILLVALSVFLIFYIDTEFIEEQMKTALHRHVTIKEINAGVFSVFSGIEVNKVAISNYKTPKQLDALKGKPVAPNDVFARLEAFNFKIKLLPIITDQKLTLKELVLYSPKINIIKLKNGLYNFSDMVAKPSKLKKTASRKPAPQKKSNPLKSSDIPVAINIGKIGLEKATINYYDKELGQSFIVYNTTVLIQDIEIDPKNIKDKNNISITYTMGVKTVGKVKSGSVESFDIQFSTNGTIKPFDTKTKELNPELSLKMGMPKGTITGLQIFEKIKTIKELEKYTGKLSFLKKKQSWKDAYVSVWYKNGLIVLKDGKIKTKEYLLGYKGKTNINSKQMNIDLDMVLADKNKKPIRRGIYKNVKKVVKGKIKKLITPKELTDLAMEELLNDKGQIYFKYKVTGTYNDPKTKLLHPKLSSLTDLAKKAAGKVGDKVKEKAKKRANKVKKKASKKAKKKSKKLRKKLGI